MLMNKNLLIGVGLLTIVGGGVAWFLMSDDTEETYTLANGVKGTAEELIAQGYIPLQFGDTIKWVSKVEYEKAQTGAAGDNNTLVTILNAAGAILPIIGSTINTVQKNKLKNAIGV